MMLGLALAWIAICAGCWLGWQLLRQNGRLLLRLEALEERLNEFEFGEDEANRFSNRSLTNSKIKRDGLKAGTVAPEFRLPRLDGRGELVLSELRGRRVLLVFSSPHCGPCNTLAPELEKFHRSQNGTLRPRTNEERSPLTPAISPSDGERVADGPGQGKFSGISVVMISKGEPKENRAKVKEHGLTFPIVLQQQWKISRRYAMFATPIAYLLDEAGVIVRDVAVGTEAILGLMAAEAAKESCAEPAALSLVSA
jgi:peroxiredoxin